MENLREASNKLKLLSTNQKNKALVEIRNAIIENTEEILEANMQDLEAGVHLKMKGSLLDRLTLTHKRLNALAESIDDVIDLKDPVGVYLSGQTMPNGMQIVRRSVPMGVIAIIYEARPNVTIDATILAIKSGNAILLRGSSSALNSNIALVKAIKQGLAKSDVPVDAVMLIEDNDRDVVKQIITANEYIDLVIPRGGAELINMVVENATVPTIETGVGNCHLYVDKDANLGMALDLLQNGKLQRPSVCNALETLLLHKDVADSFLHKMYFKLRGCLEFRGCERTAKIIDVTIATDEDYATEFLDYVIAIKIVDDIDEAIKHIQKYSSNHSECIVTDNLTSANKFVDSIDSSCVYINASTRFTDGGEFGFGAEMGISTQKMQVRGPVGLEHLVSYKYIITGTGQIRE
ncbi:MAG: glutamate-5-semialdehyde dehydrogenase [Epulopiscium sp. Nuni2H_MBin003]|nr:MAG: glutamate-5-semialdehyde dehydrogenase [Epulopiscium sp. Nuni2H_MBin003]